MVPNVKLLVPTSCPCKPSDRGRVCWWRASGFPYWWWGILSSFSFPLWKKHLLEQKWQQILAFGYGSLVQKARCWLNSNRHVQTAFPLRLTIRGGACSTLSHWKKSSAEELGCSWQLMDGHSSGWEQIAMRVIKQMRFYFSPERLSPLYVIGHHKSVVCRLLTDYMGRTSRLGPSLIFWGAGGVGE